MSNATVLTLLELPEALHDAVINYLEASGKDYDQTIQQWIALGLLQSLPQTKETKSDRKIASQVYLEGIFNQNQ